jgi:hypothetical protein
VGAPLLHGFRRVANADFVSVCHAYAVGAALRAAFTGRAIDWGINRLFFPQKKASSILALFMRL